MRELDTNIIIIRCAIYYIAIGRIINYYAFFGIIEGRATSNLAIISGIRKMDTSTLIPI
jgi:hypothetical protein